jgi:hypothetical protein
MILKLIAIEIDNIYEATFYQAQINLIYPIMATRSWNCNEQYIMSADKHFCTVTNVTLHLCTDWK